MDFQCYEPINSFFEVCKLLFLATKIPDHSKGLSEFLCLWASCVFIPLPLGWKRPLPAISSRKIPYLMPLITLHNFYGKSSVQFSHSVASNSLRPHELQHARPPCPSPTPGSHSNSRPSSWRCHPVISSSVIPFSFCPQSLPASESFPLSQLFP